MSRKPIDWPTLDKVKLAYLFGNNHIRLANRPTDRSLLRRQTNKKEIFFLSFRSCLFESLVVSRGPINEPPSDTTTTQRAARGVSLVSTQERLCRFILFVKEYIWSSSSSSYKAAVLLSLSLFLYSSSWITQDDANTNRERPRERSGSWGWV